MSTLLDQIGGKDAVTAAVNRFYDKIAEDEVLAPFFADTNMDHQRRRQISFLSSLMAGTAKQADLYMRSVHRPYVQKMGLNESHFVLVAGHLDATLRELNVPGDVHDQVMAAVAGLQDAVLDKPVSEAA